jgi:hypothetical protein
MLSLQSRDVSGLAHSAWVPAFAGMTVLRVDAKACTATYLRGGVNTLGNAFGSVSG